MEENFVCRIESNARRYGSKTALLWEGHSLTWNELDRRASGFAHWLVQQGIKPGDRVATLLPNQWSFAVAFLGGLKVGAVLATLNPGLKQEELKVILADLKPKRVVDDVAVEDGSWITPSRADVPALIVYTSGSTGRPKGAVFTDAALTFGTQAWGGPVMALTEQDVVLGVLPFAHNYGMYGGLLAPLLCGATVAMVEHFAPEAVFDAIKKYRVTVLPGVATVFRRLLVSPAFSNADLSSLRLAVAGAAPCPWELIQEWCAKTGTRILRGYGMTEVPRPISYFADNPADFPDAIGRPVPGVELRVSDEAGNPLPCGEIGELWIKSPSALECYLDAPEETREILVDGWLKTGDLASISPEGFVRIAGRKRERILRGGFSVFPQEVEAALLSHPAVAEAAVVGVPDPDLGEEVAAYVSLKAAAVVTIEELIGYCKERLTYYKYPRRIIVLDELPKNPTGKIQKSELVKRQL